MKKLLPIIITVIIVITVIAPTNAGAAEQVTLTAIPPRLELSALPGATLQETIKVRNDSDTEMALEVTTNDFIVTDNKGTPLAVSETVSGLPAGKAGRWSLASWIIATPKQFMLKPGETRGINLIIALPKNALPGGHYAMITYQQPQTGLMKNTGSAIIQKVGTLAYLNVIGPVTEAVNLKTFKSDVNFKNYGPINLSAEIENLGDIHIRPLGTVTVTDLLGRTVLAKNLEEKNIFPFASRVYDFSVAGKWRLGRYTARLDAVAGSSQIPLHGLINLWIIPVKEISLAAAAVLVFIILLAVKRRRRVKLSPETPLPETPQIS